MGNKSGVGLTYGYLIKVGKKSYGYEITLNVVLAWWLYLFWKLTLTSTMAMPGPTAVILVPILEFVFKKESIDIIYWLVDFH